MGNRILWQLHLEWLKFRDHSAFRVLIIAYVTLLSFGMLIFKALPELPGGTMFEDLYTFPSIWKWLGYAGNWLSFFCLGFLGVLSVTTEFSNRTARQNIITGMSRDEFFVGKVILILTVALVATVVYTMAGLTYGFLNSTFLSPSHIFGTAGAWVLGRYFLMCLGYLSIGLIAGLLLRKTGLSIFLYLMYAVFGEPFFRWVIHMKAIGGRSMIYYPVNALGYIMPPPLGMNELSTMTEKSGVNFLMSTGEATIVTVVFVTSFLLLGRFVMLKKDL